LGKLRERRKRSRCQRVIKLGYIDRNSENANRILDASDDHLKKLDIEKNQDFYTLSVGFVGGYIEDLPDGKMKNEMFLSIETETFDENGNSEPVTYTYETKINDNHELAGMNNRMIFNNLKIKKKLELEIQLIEKDSGLKKQYDKFKAVSESDTLKNGIDIAYGVPYVKLATSLMEGVVNLFGSDHDDQVWDECPTLAIEPLDGMAYLRSGLYVIFEARNIKKGQEINAKDLIFENNKVRHKNGVTMSNYLLMSIRIK